MRSNEHSLQISDTQVLGLRFVNETRFQFIASRDEQAPVSTAPTVTVQGAFVGGGNNSGAAKDSQNRLEFQDIVTAALGHHAVNFSAHGCELTHDQNITNAGFNGNYVYQSLGDYAAGRPSEYNVTAGNATAALSLFDAAVFYQDDWTVKPNLTFSYGLRYEGQNHIGDHADLAPRLAVAWAPMKDGKKGNTVFRGGYGWFFDRFAAGNVLTSIRENGINQVQYVVKNPTFTSETPGPRRSLLPAAPAHRHFTRCRRT